MRVGFEWRSALFIVGLCLAAEAFGEPRLLIQRAQVAGFAYHAGAGLWAQLHEGDVVVLVREPANPHDLQAVRVDLAGAGQADATLGYLARTENGAVARALESGRILKAHISRLRDTPNPRNRIEIEIWATLPASH